MKKYFFFVLLLTSTGKIVFAQGALTDKVNKAFSLVGHWEIIKMEVVKASTVTNPSTIPEASVGSVTINVSSELGSYGSFDIGPGGSISGSGEAQYMFRVAAGSTVASGSPSIPIASLGITLPVGAVAMMHNDNGVRKFSITGSADLVNRTINLNAFKTEGNSLNMIIYPGAKTFTSKLWPPMTNVESKVIVTGASLLLRASGVLNGIKVSFEAVKYVDLASLFSSIEDLVKNGANGANGTNGNNGSNGRNGTNGTNNNNNNNNNSPNNNTGNNGSKGSNSNTNTNPKNDSSNNGPQPLIAGNITADIGSSAIVVFKIPQATPNYAISLAAMNVLGEQPLVTYSDKTEKGFKVNVVKTGNASGKVKIDWLVTPYTN